MMKTKMVIAVVWLILAIVAPAACKTVEQNNAPTQTNQAGQQNSTVTVTPTPVIKTEEAATSDEMKVLSEGNNHSMEKPFIAVVRDTETYAALRGEVGDGLPEISADLFQTRAVVAAFLGTRRTGGFSISITKQANGVWRIAQIAPPPDAMTTMALTSPFKIVSVPVREPTPLTLEIGDAWKGDSYAIKEGQFVSAGGLAGKEEEFNLQGEVRQMQLGKLLTVIFDLKSARRNQPRTLRTAATGINSGGSFTLSHLDAGSLVDQPNSGLRAVGLLAGPVLTITFEPRPTNIADGYSGSGKLSATLTRSGQTTAEMKP